jgi:hypothetical protein
MIPQRAQASFSGCSKPQCGQRRLLGGCVKIGGEAAAGDGPGEVSGRISQHAPAAVKARW